MDKGLVCIGLLSLLIALLLVSFTWSQTYKLLLWCLLLPGLFVVWLLMGGWKTVRLIVRTLPRDIRALIIFLKIDWQLKELKQNNATVTSMFVTNAHKFAKKTLFIFEGRKYTFEDVDHYSNMIANYFQQEGFKKGDAVGLFMQNRPEFVIYWLGLAKIGVISALMNFNLRMETLVHSIEAADCIAMVYGSELQEAIEEVKTQLVGKEKFKMYYTGPSDTPLVNTTFLDPLIQNCSNLPPKKVELNFNDKLFYIYTSGTTGLPKAAIIRNSRCFMGVSLATAFHIQPDDVIYISLPLYHTNGGILGLSQAILHGCTAVIKRKFSASAFWEDCITHKCTVAVYIGEICRYLLAQPKKLTDNQHKVRLMFGNGLRPQIWEEFVHRFGIQQIGEFYGATEGNATLLNLFNKIGAVGFLSRLVENFVPLGLIRTNEETNEYIRDSEGLCIRCKPGEHGELVAGINNSDPMRQFDGYVNKVATNKKIIQNVFRKGDSAFTSGDLLVMDEDGYIYFKDRLGDTFRWRGENVSTSQVETAISKIIGLKDVVVYGVTIPGIEGKAGMAVIADMIGSDTLEAFASQLKKSLPAYACPVFLRLGYLVETTGTFKFKKTNLQQEGFNPNVVSGQLFYMNPKSGQFEALTKEVYDSIISGKIRL